MEVCVGDILSFENSSFFSADLILLASSEPQGMCYIETANLDGETNLNIRSVLICTSGMTYPIDLARMAGHMGAEQPNRHLYEFAGNTVLKGEQTDTLPVSATQLLLRGARLRNTSSTTVDIVTDYQIMFLFVILVLSLVSAIGNLIKNNNRENHKFYIKADENSGSSSPSSSSTTT